MAVVTVVGRAPTVTNKGGTMYCLDAMNRKRKVVRTVGTCPLCEDPIYNFQAVTDGMHAGCAALTPAERIKYGPVADNRGVV